MFHFDAKTETYTAFLSHLAGVLGTEAIHTELVVDDDLVFGSDEERPLSTPVINVFLKRL